VEAGPPSLSYRARKFLRRNKGPVVAATLVFLALIGGIIGTGMGLGEAERARAAEAKQRGGGVAETNVERAERAAERESKAKIGAEKAFAVEKLAIKKALEAEEELRKTAVQHYKETFAQYVMAQKNLSDLRFRAAQILQIEYYEDELLERIAYRLVREKQHYSPEIIMSDILAFRVKMKTDSYSTFNAKAMLGTILLAQKKYADAEPLLKEGYEGMKQREKTMPPIAKVRLTEALERLVQLHDATGNAAEADRWRKELTARKAAEKEPKK